MNVTHRGRTSHHRTVSFDAPTMTEAMKTFKIVTAIADSAVQGKYG